MTASLVAVLTVVMFATSCTGSVNVFGSPTSPIGSASPSPKVTPSVQPVTDRATFADALERAGFSVRLGKRTDSDELFRPAMKMFIDGVQVRAFEYPTAKALDEVRSSVSRDGFTLPTRTGGIAIVEWVNPPHFFSAGALLVLYLGDKQRTIGALTEVLGAPFAGR